MRYDDWKTTEPDPLYDPRGPEDDPLLHMTEDEFYGREPDPQASSTRTGDTPDCVAELRLLVTELCDALDRCDPMQISIQEIAALIQRAREAVK